MALDSTAADAVLTRFCDQLETLVGRTIDASARTNLKNGAYGILVREIFAEIKSSAEVLPDGSPTPLTDGDSELVTGKGRIQ